MTAVVVMQADPAFGQDQQEEPTRNWSNATEFSWVVSTGNSDANTFQIRNVYSYRWTNAEFSWQAGIMRAGSGDDKVAVGTQDDFEVFKPERELDSNRWFTKALYTREVHQHFFWYASWDGSRDEPSNINRQVITSSGLGHTWYDREGLVLRMGNGVSYTNEDLDLEGARNFAGYRIFYRLRAAVTESSEIESELTLDGSFETGADIRLDALNSIRVAINDTIALKASLRLLYRNLPALEDIDLEDSSGLVIGKVVIPKAKLDTTFVTSLVINF